MFELILGESMQPKRGFSVPAPDERRVADLMTRPQPIVPSHISMGAARKIAQLKAVDVLIVEDRGSLMGFLDSQILQAAPDDRRVAECLKPIPFCLNPMTTLERTRELLIQHGVSSLPVAAGPFLVGSISRSAVERFLAAGVAAAGPLYVAA